MVNSMLLEREAELGILGELVANLDSTGDPQQQTDTEPRQIKNTSGS